MPQIRALLLVEEPLKGIQHEKLAGHLASPVPVQDDPKPWETAALLELGDLGLGGFSE